MGFRPLRSALLISVLALPAAFGLVLAVPPPALELPPTGIVLEDVTVVDPGRERVPHRRVSVRDDTIARIEPAGPGASAGPYAGAYVLPGLIDLHVHHPTFLQRGEREHFALSFLAYGVTSVRDTGATLGSVLPHAQRIAAAELAGPRVFACGPFLDGDPPEWPTALRLPNRQAARDAVRALAAQGVSCVKVYNAVSQSVYAAIQEEAEALGIPVVVHVPDRVPFERLGAVEVQHLMGLSWDWTHVDDTEIDSYVRASQVQGIRHTPTLVVFQRTRELADYGALRRQPAARFLPSYYRDVLWNPDVNPLVLELAPVLDASVETRYRVMQETVRRLHAAGVPILAGTDTLNPFVVPGAALQEELGELAAAGLGVEGAWVAATRQAAEALQRPDLGVVREGAAADLLVFREDPSRDLAALTTLELVVAQGRPYPRAQLEQTLARQGAYFQSPLRDWITSRIARLIVRFFPPSV